MLKINLLPKSFGEKKRVRNAALLLGVVLIFIVGAFFGWYNSVGKRISDEKAAIASLQPDCDEVDRLEKSKTAIEGQNAALKAKVDFIEAVLKYNGEYPRVLNLVDDWIYAKVQVVQLTLGGAGGGNWDQVALTCYTDSFDSFVRQYNFILDSTQYFNNPSVSDPTPGFGWPTSEGATISSESLGGPTGLFRQETGYAFSMSFGLKEPYAIKAPQYTAGGVAPAPGTGTQAGMAPPPAPGPAPGGGGPVGGGSGQVAPGERPGGTPGLAGQ
jgi:hypothetical protein